MNIAVKYVVGFIGILCALIIPNDLIASEVDDSRMGWYPILNARASTSQDWSIELGSIIGTSQRSGSLFAGATGMYFSVEPGGNGIKLNGGYGFGLLAAAVPFSWRAGPSYYRVWKENGGIHAGGQYIGIQAGGSYLFVSGSAGVYVDVEQGSSLFSAGIGLGW